MKVLLDTCVSGGLLKVIEASGHDVIWSGEWENDPGDIEILAFAHKEGRILVTLDKDFGELAILHGHLHCGIIRLVNLSLEKQVNVCEMIINKYGDELYGGAIITVDANRVRIRSSKI